MCWRCVSLSRDATQDSSMYRNSPSRPAQVQSIILWKVWALFDRPKGVNKFSNKPKGVMMAVFGIILSGNWNLVKPLDQNQFCKKLCNHPSRLKGITCFGGVLLRGSRQVKTAVIAIRPPWSVLFGYHVQRGSPWQIGTTDDACGF